MFDNPPIQIFGEVLFDHFPDGSRVLGGAPFNVAWNLQAFKQRPLLISRIGIDASGHEISELMKSWGMRQDALQADPLHPTGKVEISIEDNEPHYDIVVDSAYDFIDGQAIVDLPTDGILYHGSLALRNPVSRAALEAAKRRYKGKIFVDVNLRPPWWETKTLSTLLSDADWVKLNEDELFNLCPGHNDLPSVMSEFLLQYQLDLLVVTCGAKGAIALKAGQPALMCRPKRETRVVDTVGAGDAFASVLLLGMVKQWPLSTVLERAQEFASAVVGIRGATTSDGSFYAKFIDRWL